MDYSNEYEGPWARPRTDPIDLSDWRYQRPVTRAEKCTHCGVCYMFCPTGCITDYGTHFAAKLDYCKGCGICSRECPVRAIVIVREERV